MIKSNAGVSGGVTGRWAGRLARILGRACVGMWGWAGALPGEPAPAGQRATTQPPAEPVAALPAGLLPRAGSGDGQPHAGSRASLSWSSRGGPPRRKAGGREHQHGKLPAGLGGTHFSCSTGPRGRTWLVGGAGADDGSLCIHLNRHPYPGHRRWWGNRSQVCCIPLGRQRAEEKRPRTSTRGSRLCPHPRIAC